MLSFLSPCDIQRQLAVDLRDVRIRVKNWKRETLAERSGVPASTIKRFETTGEISLRQLLMLVHALEMLGRFEKLLRADDDAGSMKEYLQRQQHSERKRGSR